MMYCIAPVGHVPGPGWIHKSLSGEIHDEVPGAKHSDILVLTVLSFNLGMCLETLFSGLYDCALHICERCF